MTEEERTAFVNPHVNLAWDTVKTWPFLAYACRHKLPTVPGVYVAVVGENVIVYVGKAHNLRTRWRYHEIGARVLPHFPHARIVYHPCKDPWHLECTLIHTLHPWWQRLMSYYYLYERRNLIHSFIAMDVCLEHIRVEKNQV